MTDNSDHATCTCKVGSVLDTYDIPEYDERLVEYWTSNSERYSLRALADTFNRRVLRAAMASAGMQTLSGEVENLYRLLTGDDVTSGMRTQTRDQLRTNGVPIEDVEEDFVSHQTIYRHLTGCRNIERSSPDPDANGDRRDRGIQTVQSLRGKTLAVTANTIDRLVQSGDLTLEDFDVYVDITVACNDCGRQVPIEEQIERGGCPCHLDE